MARKGIITTNPLYWLPANVPEWLGKLAGGLTTEQFGAAVLLLLTSWEQRQPCTLPNDGAFLAQRSGLGPRWGRLGARILEVTQFYPAQDGRLVCGWLLTLYKEQLERYENRSRAGKENQAKRGQSDLFPVTNSSTNAGTNGRTNEGTVASTNTSQNEKLEGVAPYGANTLPQFENSKQPGALAPSDARAGSELPIERTPRQPLKDNRPFRLTDILLAGGVPRPEPVT